MTIGRIKDAKIFELLKDFVRQQELENAEEEQKVQDKRSASIYHMDPTLYERAMDDTERFFRAHSTRFGPVRDLHGRKKEMKNCAVNECVPLNGHMQIPTRPQRKRNRAEESYPDWKFPYTWHI